MLDNVLIPLIIQTLIAGEAIAGIPGLPIAASFQPTRQGVPTQPSAFIYKIADKRYGFRKTEDCWDTDTSTLVHKEVQTYETIFQLSALATQNPATPTQYTASDILNLCASVLQSQVSVATFIAAGVGIERVTDVRNPYFLDDRSQFEASPSFDMIFSHKQIIISSTPILTSIELKEFAI